MHGELTILKATSAPLGLKGSVLKLRTTTFPAKPTDLSACRHQGQLAMRSIWPHLSREQSALLLFEAATGQTMGKTPKVLLFSQASALRPFLGLGSVGLVVHGLGPAVEQQLKGRKFLFLL